MKGSMYADTHGILHNLSYPSRCLEEITNEAFIRSFVYISKHINKFRNVNVMLLANRQLWTQTQNMHTASRVKATLQHAITSNICKSTSRQIFMRDLLNSLKEVISWFYVLG